MNVDHQPIDCVLGAADTDAQLPLTATRDRLLRAATELLLTRGYADTNIHRICRAAGTSYSTFTHYFGRKRHIAHEVADTLATRATHRISRTIPRDTDHLITTLAIWASILATRPGWVSLEFALAALDDTSRTEVSDRVGVIGDALTELLTATTFDTSGPRIDVDLVVTFLFTVVIGMSVQHDNGIDTTISGIRPHIELILRTAQL
ncbi:TetR/AcrR family transcriptional regulator [Nocardia bhagyanarayanae]|uniref:TetR family transcriptional regulator n=1 Tax=Nocardia bhagyanarayanae TaxID=1215925 RepID=A0A543FFS3_9NOCA|nr:TetR/AcrR family transcriptional regulator [Nocardia bhagyanarayanae]TQM32709.1 TetR family transcriptional regulator [Nocardia bhagyanarayanae]